MMMLSWRRVEICMFLLANTVKIRSLNDCYLLLTVDILITFSRKKELPLLSYLSNSPTLRSSSCVPFLVVLGSPLQNT
jgi:hypothetical protein